MKQIIKIALLLILITYSGWAVAKNSNPIHTHTNTPMELKPVSSNLGISYAAVCFLGSGDCGAGSFDKSDNDMGIDTGKQCQNEGYIYTSSNCVLPSYLKTQCPYNSAYYSECKQDIPQACTEAGYTKESKCVSGMKLKKSPRCPWDNSYGICCKETCPNNSSLSCTGIIAGDDTCGYDCKQCCDNNCPSGSFENRTGSGGCGGSAIQNGCKTKTCYYPYTNCPPPPSNATAYWYCHSRGWCIDEGYGGNHYEFSKRMKCDNGTNMWDNTSRWCTHNESDCDAADGSVMWGSWRYYEPHC